MPPEALHTATRMPTITVAREPLLWFFAEVTAVLNTCAALPGRALLRPLIRWSTWLASRLTRLTNPSSAMRAGNRARNQW